MKGEVVSILFPFSNLAGAKARPALVLASLPGNDLVLCQITSQPSHSTDDVPLTQGDFQQGSLRLPSIIRPYHIFTLEDTLVIKQIRTLHPTKMAAVTQALTNVLNR